VNFAISPKKRQSDVYAIVSLRSANVQMSQDGGDRRFYDQSNRQPIMTRPTPIMTLYVPNVDTENMITRSVAQQLANSAWGVPE